MRFITPPLPRILDLCDRTPDCWPRPRWRPTRTRTRSADLATSDQFPRHHQQPTPRAPTPPPRTETYLQRQYRLPDQPPTVRAPRADPQPTAMSVHGSVLPTRNGSPPAGARSGEHTRWPVEILNAGTPATIREYTNIPRRSSVVSAHLQICEARGKIPSRAELPHRSTPSPMPGRPANDSRWSPSSPISARHHGGDSDHRESVRADRHGHQNPGSR